MEKNEKSLGFLYGYKETKMEDGKFSVFFKRGFSEKYPKKFEKFKDFWSEQIFLGQTSNLFLNPKEFIEAFKIELKEQEQYRSDFEKRKYLFNYDINFDQYKVLNAFSMAFLHVNMYQTWETEKVLENVLEQTIKKEFINDKRGLLEIYNDFKKTSEVIYNKEISEALGEFFIPEETSTPKRKMKP